MKGYFIPFGARKIVSIDKKIDMQIQQLSTAASIEEVDVDITSKNFFRNALSVLPYIELPWDYTAAYQKIQNPDFIFMRRTGADRSLIKFLKYIKTRYPQCKVVMEVATYPYIRESLQRIDGWVLLLKDLYNRRKLKKYVDRIVTYSDDLKIFDISTIRVMNGIDVKSIKPIYDDGNSEARIIRLLAVGVLQKSHGYERCIKGLAQYYFNNPSRVIEIHIVGEGTELNYYKNLVAQYHLENYVIFYGRKIGAELDQIYNNMDIALGPFGAYKRRIFKSSSLKIREYLAKGLPIISGCREDVFDDTPDYPFYLQMPNDNSLIDMRDILCFYDCIYCGNITRQTVHDKIREFAKIKVDMGITMKPIIEYLQ